MAEYIEKAEMDRQREYILKLKEACARFCVREGHAPVAVTQTYGCQQNENDTERIRGVLHEAGFVFGTDERQADVVIYNTCAVRENAEQKVFGRLGILKHIKESRPQLLVGLCGCMVQQPHITEKLKRTYPHVDLIFGTHALYKLPELLYTAWSGRSSVVDITDSDGRIAEDMPILRETPQKAWVSVMYGCNNFCSYCIVPYVRGRERSRTPEAVLAEVRALVADGCTEISLLGQNVNSYGKDLDGDVDFSALLRMVNAVEGVERIRFMTSHPKDFSDRLIDAMADCQKVCRQLHLPFQAGSDKVLQDMNRRYTKTEYLEKIRKVKARIPGISLSTDVIVGFPTETNEDFEQTLDVIRQCEFDSIFSFIYSKREGTPAANMDFVLSEAEIHRNFERLLKTQNEISKRKNEAYVGKTVRVLVDGVSKTDETALSGRTEEGKIVNFQADPALAGRYVQVEVTEAHTWSLNGQLVRAE